MATTEPVTAGKATTNLQNYANQLYKSLIAQAPTIDYTPRSEAQLRDNLLKSYQASYDQSINNRRQTTRQNRGAIDSDAASRGIGSSTWVTDAKLRQNDNEARDLTSLRANRDSTIAQQLAAALGNQEDNQLAVKQYNASLRATALNNALSTAGTMYDKFKAEDPALKAAASGGGGGWGGYSDGGGGGGGGGYSGSSKPTSASFGNGVTKISNSPYIYTTAPASAYTSSAAKAKSTYQPYVYTSAPAAKAPSAAKASTYQPYQYTRPASYYKK